MTRKRKRALGVGQYTDVETGEVRIVETSRHVKQQYKKSGTCYKQPTEKELRQWDRQDTLLDRANKIKQREENKRNNAEKRVQRLTKEREAVERQYAEGKITFTQTLARKDEDQLNLHKWFGGHPKDHTTPTSLDTASNGHNGCTDTQDIMSLASNSLSKAAGSLELSGQAFITLFNDDEDEDEDRSLQQASQDLQLGNDPNTKIYTLASTNIVQASSKCQFTSATTESKPLLPSNKTILSANGSASQRHNFKIPELPQRHLTDSQAQQAIGETKSCADKNAPAVKEDVSSKALDDLILPDTSAVEDLLAGISTQDLQDYGDSDKENVDRLRVADVAKCEDYDDGGVDDHTLLLAFSSPCSPTLELSLLEKNQQRSMAPISKQPKNILVDVVLDFGFENISFSDTDLLQIAAGLDTDSGANNNESFAMDGIEDDDLLEGLACFEHEGSSSTEWRPSISRKKRVLPWDLPTQEGMVCTVPEDEFEHTQET